MRSYIECSILGKNKDYFIEIECGVFNHARLIDYLFQIDKQLVIITDDQVKALYANQLCDRLHAQNKACAVLSFPSGEEHKTRQTKEMLENSLFEMGYGRDTCIIAIGGGVVTDLAGYLAATYCRGVKLILIPTTLMAMVDASIGGKNGVNSQYGKNLIGTIYQPQKIIIDPLFIKTLSQDEFKNGISEMIKHGLIASSTYFDFLELDCEKIVNRDWSTVFKSIVESCLIKKNIIEKDVQESNERLLLNFGHTFAHALEHASHYSIAHGKAVAIGMIAESYLAMQLVNFPLKSFERIQKIIKSFAIEIKCDLKNCVSEIRQCMTLDKKAKKKRPHFILLDAIGTPHQNYCSHVPEDLLLKTIEWMVYDLCCY